jgi:predicted RNA binding protein YcfA (HicA-like mRNA interferase family)
MKHILLLVLMSFNFVNAQNAETKYVVDHGEIYINRFDTTGYIVSAQTGSHEVYYKYTDSAKDTIPMFEEAKKSLVNHLDTLNFKVIDSIEIDASNKRVTLIREKPDFDWLKYIFPILTLILGFFLNYFRDKNSEKIKVEATGKRWISEYTNLVAISE